METTAVAQALIQKAQTEYGQSCNANPLQATCQKINQAVAAQNLLIDAAESYCGWPTRPSAAELQTAAATCQHIQSAQQGLSVAVRNVKDILGDLKAVTK